MHITIQGEHTPPTFHMHFQITVRVQAWKENKSRKRIKQSKQKPNRIRALSFLINTLVAFQDLQWDGRSRAAGQSPALNPILNDFEWYCRLNFFKNSILRCWAYYKSCLMYFDWTANATQANLSLGFQIWRLFWFDLLTSRPHAGCITN